jgi:hypothetical protein
MGINRHVMPHSIGVALVVAGGLSILFAMLLGPLLVGSFAGPALLSYPLERLLLALCGAVVAVVGWIFCGSTNVQ